MENAVKKWGVVPFRELDNENLEFLIVSTKNGNWGLPKGNLMNKLGPKKTALQEAYEEAGILGRIVDQKISTKVNGKRMAFYPMKAKVKFPLVESDGGNEDGFDKTNCQTT